MDLNKDTKAYGAYTGKPDFLYAVYKYKKLLNGVNEIHHAASSKYKPLGWLVHPSDQDSSFIDNINAIYRHYAAHMAGKYFDPESEQPHVLHMCTRASMIMACTNTVLPKDFSTVTLVNNEAPASYVFPNLIATLCRESEVDLPKSIAQLICFLNAQLVEASTFYSVQMHNPDSDIRAGRYIAPSDLNAPLDPIQILVIAIFAFARHELEHMDGPHPNSR